MVVVGPPDAVLEPGHRATFPIISRFLLHSAWSRCWLRLVRQESGTGPAPTFVCLHHPSQPRAAACNTTSIHHNQNTRNISYRVGYTWYTGPDTKYIYIWFGLIHKSICPLLSLNFNCLCISNYKLSKLDPRYGNMEKFNLFCPCSGAFCESRYVFVIREGSPCSCPPKVTEIPCWLLCNMIE